MHREALRVIRDEHATLTALLNALLQMVQRGPEADGKDRHELYFDVLRAMLFYIDEFPERHHHPKESDLLFPRLARAAPHTLGLIEQLEQEHMTGEQRVRELIHLLMAWEYLGEPRRRAFEDEVTRYVGFYLQHIRQEEAVILPEAEKHLSEADWRVLNAAFASNRDPLCSSIPRDPLFDRLFARILISAPAPVGLGH